MSPRTDEQNQALRAESRARMLDAAMELFARYGYEQTSVRMIARAAGVAQGLLYSYFASKEQLLQAIFEQSIHDVRESFALAEDAADPRPQLERLIRGAFAIIQRNRRFWQLSYNTRTQVAVITELNQALGQWTGFIHTTLEGYFRSAGAADPAVEAAILFATIDGVAQHYVLQAETYPLQMVEDRLVQIYCREQQV